VSQGFNKCLGFDAKARERGGARSLVTPLRMDAFVVFRPEMHMSFMPSAAVLGRTIMHLQPTIAASTFLAAFHSTLTASREGAL
jgi:hypothetical protein